MFADTLLTGIVSQHSLQNSPLDSSCVVVALIEKCSTSKPLKGSPEKSQVLSCVTVVANERYNTGIRFLFVYYNEKMHSYVIQVYITAATLCNLHKVTVVIYRMSIKCFPDYKHLLQENYVEYKYIFLPLLRLIHKILWHVFITLQLHNHIPRSFLVINVCNQGKTL
jgi:hypothetical protein